jgi:diguanylate cyclase (GGDEF)-like protein
VSISRRRGIYRQQALLVFSGFVVAVTANVLYLTGVLGPVPLDITPLSLTGAVGLFYAGVSRARLLELIPAARHRVIDVMPDGLVVLDSEFRVVDWNPATLRLWNIDRSDIMGTPIADLVPGWTHVVPDDIQESFRGAIEENEESLVSHHIDVELRRIVMERSSSHGWIVLFHDSTELRAAERSLQDANVRLETLNRELALQAVRDGLTGLYNRNYLDEVLPREIARAARAGTCVGLVILDIDHFKDINDRFGHGVGDRLLIQVGGRVRAQVRSADIPCRYGGDEMVVVMPGATSDEAIQIGVRIRDEICGTGLQTDDGLVKVTVSVGVAVYPTDAGGANELLRNADRALYLAKSQGRDRVVGADRV